MPVLDLLLRESKSKDFHQIDFEFRWYQWCRCYIYCCGNQSQQDSDQFTFVYNDISDASATSIVEAIKVSKTLTNLNLAGNGISDTNERVIW